jgi:hypothetical protein
MTDVSLEAFRATEFNETFSARQPHQEVTVFLLSGTNSVPIFGVLLGGLVEQKLQQFISQN